MQGAVTNAEGFLQHDVKTVCQAVHATCSSKSALVYHAAAAPGSDSTLESSADLQSLEAGANWKQAYQRTAKAVAKGGGKPWKMDSNAVFAQMDAFMQRCRCAAICLRQHTSMLG